MRPVAGLLYVLCLCGCSTPYLLPHHRPETRDVEGAGTSAVTNRSASGISGITKGDALILVFAGESVTQPFGGCLDYERKKIVAPASSYSMSRPGLALYEKTVDALRSRGYSVDRLYLPQTGQAAKKQLFLNVEEMEVYRIHKKKGDRIVSKAIVLCRTGREGEWSRQRVRVDISAENDVFAALAEALLSQILL